MKFLQYILENVKYTECEKNEIIGLILTSFVIEKNGAVSNIKILKGTNFSNIKEVLEKMPKWLPGKQNNMAKRVKMQLPIRICRG